MLRASRADYRDEDAFVEHSIDETLLTIGELYGSLNEKEAARNYNSQALSSTDTEVKQLAWIRLGRDRYETTYHAIGERYESLGDFQKAEEFYRKAKEAELKSKQR